MEARIIIVGAMTLIIFAVGGCLWLIETEGGAMDGKLPNVNCDGL